MAQAAWEKPQDYPPLQEKKAAAAGRTRGAVRHGRWKFLAGGALILGSIAYLVISGTLTGARYFITVDALLADPAYVGQTVRISGAVIGDSIVYDSENLLITFTISHIPQEFDNLAQALHDSVNNPAMSRLTVVYEGVKPDLLQHEAQAILSGILQPDGTFHATELLLKCPSRFEEGGSNQSIGEDHPGITGNAG